MALVFTDIIRSTEYIEKYGDTAGKALFARKYALLDAALKKGGRIVDTAGDGAFCVFDTSEAAARALIAFQLGIARSNDSQPSGHSLHVRCGLHSGDVLVDDNGVSGDAVHVAICGCAVTQPPKSRSRASPAPSTCGR